MNSKKRILSFLLALVMVFGSFPSVFAEGISDQTAQREKTVEIEGKNDGRKLVFNLQEKTNSLRKASTLANGPRRAPADGPGYGENDVKVKINLSGVNEKEFPFAKIFPNGAKVKLELLDMDTFDTTTVEKDFTSNGQEIDFGIYKEDQIQNITIELADKVNIAGKIIQNTTSGTSGHVGTTVFNLYLYQYVNTDVKVTTVDETGKTTTNPTTAVTKGKIKVTAGQEEKEIAIPTGTDAVETFTSRDVNTANVSNFQSSPTVEVTGINDKGVLVDKANNKVYKKTEVKVDQNGINPTEVKFTEKPIWSEDNKYSTDPEYVTVTFAPGDHGTIAKNKTYYVFKGVEMESTLTPPDVTADSGWEFNGWKPALATKYDAATEHVAQYTQKTIAEQVKELGGLNPRTIKVWKDDEIDWADGVAPATTNSDDSKLVQGLLDNAKVTDQSSRSSANSGKFEGKLQVKFGDDSTLEVDNQWLYVWEHIVKVDDPTDPNSPSVDDLPNGKVKVLFEPVKNGGVKSIQTTGTTYAKNGTVFQDEDFPQDITFEDGYKGPVTWKPASHTISNDSRKGYDKRKGAFVFRASATKTDAKVITEAGGLKGIDLAAWVGDTLDADFWKDGAALADTVQDADGKLAALLAGATVTDKSNRNTTEKGTKPGTLVVTFADGSSLEVDQKLFVYNKKDVVPTDPKQPTPEDAVVVTYNKGDGVKELQGTGKTLVKSGETLTDDDFPTATLEEGRKDVTWSGQTADNPKDYTVTENNKVFTATAGKTVVPTDPENPNPGQDQVTVIFEKGLHGTLSGIDKDGKDVTGAAKLAFNVKKTATWADMAKYIPKAVAEGEWKVADPAWDPQLPANTATVTAETYTAQYAEDKTDKSDEPIIDQPYVGDDKIKGKGKSGADIVVKDNKGDEIGRTTVGIDGTWEVPVPADKPLVKGETITATQTETGKNPSNPAKAVVRAKDDTPVKPDDRPAAPAITWGGYWYLGNSSATEVEKIVTGRHIAFIYGYPDKSVKPEGMITRCEAAAMIARMAGLDLTDTSKPNFKDTPSHWYNGVINAMVKKNLMFADKDGNFRPNEPITRGEFARALLYIDHKSDKIAPFADVKGHVYEAAINQAYGNGRIDGYPDGSFKPDAPIQRAEAAKILNRFDGRKVDAKGLTEFANRLIQFTDLPKTHWAYYEIVEAANNHEYHRIDKDKIDELWTKLF